MGEGLAGSRVRERPDVGIRQSDRRGYHASLSSRC
jgi:hypothetical protein